MIQISCPTCQRKLKLADHLQGKQIRCPACKDVFRVQAPTAEVREVQPAAPVAPPPPAARPVPQPAPPPIPVPVQQDSFEMVEHAPSRPAARPGPRRRAEPEPEGEFEEMPEPGVDLRQGRRSAKRGAMWLQLAFLFALIPYVVFAVLFFGLASGGDPGIKGRITETPGRNFAMGLVIGMSALYLIPVAFVAVGATLLASLKVRGLVITACIFCFIVALELVIYTVIWLGVLGQVGRYGTGMVIFMPLAVAASSFLGFIMSVVGGIMGLVTLGRAAVKAAYRHAHARP